MSWYNPIDDIRSIYGAGSDVASGIAGIPGDIWGGIQDLGSGIGDLGQWIGHKIQAPYDQKKAGYEAIQGDVERLKKERMGQKDFAYNLANQAFDPSRKAMAAVYGDPSTWKL